MPFLASVSNYGWVMAKYEKQLKNGSNVPNTILLNIEQTRKSYFEHRMDKNMFIWIQLIFEWTSNGLLTFYLIRKCTLCIVSVTFFKREMGSIKSDLHNSYHIKYLKNLFAESFSWNTLSKFFKIGKRHWIPAWNRISYGSLMFTKCSLNSTSNIEQKLNVFISCLRTSNFEHCSTLHNGLIICNN